MSNLRNHTNPSQGVSCYCSLHPLGDSGCKNKGTGVWDKFLPSHTLVCGD